MAGHSDFDSSPLQPTDLSEEVILLNETPTPKPFDSLPLSEPLSKQRLFEASFYQHYFDIDTIQVLSRIRKTLYPKFEGSFFENEKPDLYGPFWSATTLILAIGIAGSLGSYLTGASRWAEAGSVVVSGACLVYSLMFLVPLAAYCSLSSAGSSVGLVEILSLYGYSHIPLIFGSLLCAVPSSEMQWLSMMISAAAACVPLIRNLKNEMVTLSTEQRYQIGGILVLGHLILILAVKLYFLPAGVAEIHTASD